MTGNLYFNGQWQAGSGSAFESINPSTLQPLWVGNAASNEDVSSAVASAKKAQTAWAKTPFSEREAILLRYHDILKTKQQALSELISQETGKQLWEAKTEAGSVAAKIPLSIQSYKTRTGDTKNEANGIQSQLTHRPHGVLAVLGPYNFPAHLPNGHIVPALLAGNAVVFKPSEITPAVGEFLVQCLIEAGVPSGVINLVQGAGETGISLSQNDTINGLLFTGSSRTGKALHAQFAGQPNKLLALEMGGNNPLIFDEVGDIAAAVYNTLQSAYITSGQRCTCARRLIVVKSAQSQEFIDALSQSVSKLTVDLPSKNTEAFYGPVVSNAVAEHLLKVQTDMLNNGAVALVKMTRPYQDRPLLTPALLNVTNMPERADEEHFGPILQIIEVDTLEQAIEEANNTQYGLAAGMLTDNDANWNTFYLSAQCGILNRNRPTTGASGAAPFGGVGASGNHRPSAYYAADYCAYPMASMTQDIIELPTSLSKGITL